MKKILILLLILLFTSTLGLAQSKTKTTNQASELLVRGDIDGAISVLDKVISNKKDLFEAYRMRSALRQMKGDSQGSLADLNQTIKLDSSNAELYYLRAKQKVFLNDVSALDDFNTAIANGYKSYKVYMGRAMFHRNIRNLDQAEADYRTAFGLAPESPTAIVGYASILEQQEKIDEAISVLQEFISAYEERMDGKTPNNKINVIAKSEIITNKEGTSGRDQILVSDDSVEISGGNGQPVNQLEYRLNTAAAYSSLARMQMDKGLLDTAFENIQKSLQIDGSNGYIFGIRGQIYLQKGEYKNALKDFDKSIKTMPSLPNYYIDRGITYLILENQEKAQADFDRYIEINPKGKEFLQKRIKEARQKYNLK